MKTHVSQVGSILVKMSNIQLQVRAEHLDRVEGRA